MATKKDLKDAKVYMVDIDGKKRPLTFDYNALGEVQETYDDPFSVFAGLETMNLKAIKVLVHASLVAGLAVKDEDAEFDLSVNKVGRLLGDLMMKKQEAFGDVMTKISEAIKDFLPEEAEVEQSEEAVEVKN